jgi:hypothetical protein
MPPLLKIKIVDQIFLEERFWVYRYGGEETVGKEVGVVVEPVLE